MTTDMNERERQLEEFRYVKAAARRARRNGLEREFAELYREYRACGDSPARAAFDALNSWDLLDVRADDGRVCLWLDQDRDAAR